MKKSIFHRLGYRAALLRLSPAVKKDENLSPRELEYMDGFADGIMAVLQAQEIEDRRVAHRRECYATLMGVAVGDG